MGAKVAYERLGRREQRNPDSEGGIEPDAARRQEIAFKIRGHQPVVAMKGSNVRGAKGHSHAKL